MSTDRLYSVADVAAIAGVSASSIRNWSGQFADYLSPGANPPPGTERIFTETDAAVLQQIQQLRRQHVGYSDIPARLQVLDVTSMETFIDLSPSTPVTSPTEAPQDVVNALSIVEAIDRRYTALEARLSSYERDQASKLTWFVWGVLAGLAITLIAILAILLGNLAR